MKVESYRFQKYLEVDICSNGISRFRSYFENEYGRINRSNVYTEKPAVKITLEIVKKLPSVEGETIMCSERFKRLFHYKFLIVDLHTEHVKIYFQNHPVSLLYTTAMGVFIQAQVLEPIMYLALLKKNILLMHSAGVTKEGLAYLFPAYGGTGKTTTSMSLLNQGYEFLGDDLILIDPLENQVYPYPRPLHVFTYNVRSLDAGKLPKGLKTVVYFKNLVRYVLEKTLKTEFLISTRVHVDEIIPGIQFSSPSAIHNVIFLKKQGQHESISLDSSQKMEQHANNIVESADLNQSLYRFLDTAALQEVKRKELEVTKSMLKKTTYFGYLNTRKIELTEITRYLNDVEA